MSKPGQGTNDEDLQQEEEAMGFVFEPQDAAILEETWEGEDDGRDGSPSVGSSDSPELMDQEDPLRRREYEAGEQLGDLGNSGMHVEELDEAEDDDAEW